MPLLRLDREGGRVDTVPLVGGAPHDLTADAQVVPLPDGRRWALLAREGVTVNGISSPPILLLRDRDEIHVAGQVFFFTADANPEVSVIQSDASIRCARCQGPLARGTRALKCPRCSTHHHPDCWNDGGCQRCWLPAHSPAWVPEPVW